MYFKGTHGFVIALIKKNNAYLYLANNLIKEEHLGIKFELVGMNSGLSLGMCLNHTDNSIPCIYVVMISECDFLALFLFWVCLFLPLCYSGLSFFRGWCSEYTVSSQYKDIN